MANVRLHPITIIELLALYAVLVLASLTLAAAGHTTYARALLAAATAAIVAIASLHALRALAKSIRIA